MSNDTKHTPGPWEVTVAQSVIAASGALVAACGAVGSVTRGEAKANARLIAAAPELLAACEAAIAALSQPAMKNVGEIVKGDVSFAISTLRAAIAKAKGE